MTTMLSVAEIATVAHGYTMAQIDEFAHRAVRIRRSVQNMDWDDAYDAAWHEIIVALYETADRPDPWTLIKIGINAIQDAQGENMQAHGLNRRTYEPGPNFGKYWLPVSGPVDDFTERLTERLALPQVLSQLSDLQYEALSTLAIYGSQQAAAQALGVNMPVFYERLRSARRRVFELWFAPDTPRTVTRAKDLDEICRNGHPRAQHSFKRYNPSLEREIWICRRCARNRLRRAKAKAR